MCDFEFNARAEFGCTRCGRLPHDTGVAPRARKYIGGPGPMYCRRCRAAGRYVCRGNFDNCDVRSDSLCVTHGCAVGAAPFVWGFEETSRRASAIVYAEDRARLRAEEAEGVHHGLGIDSYVRIDAQPGEGPPARGGGIFG